MYSEAMPILYSINQVRFNLKSFGRALARMPASVSKYLTNIHINMAKCSSEAEIALVKSSLKLVQDNAHKLSALDDMALTIDDDAWLLYIDSYEEIPELHGIAKLVASVKNVEIYGLGDSGCVVFEKHLNKKLKALSMETSAQSIICGEEGEAGRPASSAQDCEGQTVALMCNHGSSMICLDNGALWCVFGLRISTCVEEVLVLTLISFIRSCT